MGQALACPTARITDGVAVDSFLWLDICTRRKKGKRISSAGPKGVSGNTYRRRDDEHR